MTEMLEFLRGFNIQNIMSMGLLIWYFTRDIKASIDKLDADINKMNTRVSRIEGTVYGKDIYDKIGDEK